MWRRFKTLVRVIGQTMWSWLYFGFARHLPVSYHLGGGVGGFLRYQACRRLLKRCGRNVNAEHGAYIEQPWLLEIGDNSGIGVDSYIDGPITIGRDVMMAPDVRMYRRNHETGDTTRPMIEQGFGPFVPLVIEDDVWIGTGVIIVPSAKRIGRGSVLAAGSVVVKDVPQYAVVGGNPARVLRDRRMASARPASGSAQTRS